MSKEFFMMDNSFVDNKVLADLSNAALRVYMVLSRRSNSGKSNAWPSYASIREYSGLASDSSVKKGLDELVGKGLIAQQTTGSNLTKKSNTYKVAGSGGEKKVASKKKDKAVETKDTREATTPTYTALISPDAAPSIEDTAQTQDKPKPLPVIERAVVDSGVKRDDVVSDVVIVDPANLDGDFKLWCIAYVPYFENRLERGYETFQYRGDTLTLDQLAGRFNQLRH